MGFNKVYKSLQELFPQIDARALRAVSIEHSKDVDAAVEAVLEEIIPFFSENLSGSISLDKLCKDSISTTQSENVPTMNVDSSEETNTNSINLLPPPNPLASCTLENVQAHDETAALSEENRGQTSRKDTSDDLAISDKISFDEISGHTHEDEAVSDTNFVQDNDNSLFPTNADINPEDISINASMGEPVSLTIQIPGPSPENNVDEVQIATQSDQISITCVVDEIIADARKNKKTLFSAMESVISMMREVEVTEEAAEKANEETAKEVSHVFDKVEELKQMLKHAKEANDMHAGEVYGEKAILATELRELQSRVIFLSDERDKSLAVLDEMRHTLDMRLAAADDKIKCAEKEKQRKQKSAQEALTDQELIMESVVQESNILRQQAEENATLQDFLVDRGRVVDVLQGEIAVIYQDVKLLKEKFDEHVPLNKSFSSSQTSCLLASSTSSSKSFSQDDSVKSKQNADSERRLFVNESSDNDHKALLEDGWDFFTAQDEFPIFR